MSEEKRLRSEAARLMGQVRSQKKTDAALAGSLASAVKRTKSLAEMGCTCAAGESTDYRDHAGCPARKVLYNREKQRERRVKG